MRGEVDERADRNDAGPGYCRWQSARAPRSKARGRRSRLAGLGGGTLEAASGRGRDRRPDRRRLLRSAGPGSGSRSGPWWRWRSSSSRSASARAGRSASRRRLRAGAGCWSSSAGRSRTPAAIARDRRAGQGAARPPRAAEVLVLAPARIGFLDRWASDVEGARREAQQRLVITVASLAKAGVVAEARVGDEDLVQAVEDQLGSFAATDVILVTGSAERGPGRGEAAAAELERRLRAGFRRPGRSAVQQLAEAQRGAGRHHEARRGGGAGRRRRGRGPRARSRPARRSSGDSPPTSRTSSAAVTWTG